MVYRFIGEAAMLVHFGFLAYVALGGFLAWRWPHAFWPHLVVAAYAVGLLEVGWTCPLTVVEDWARRRAGQEGLPPEGFIDHYLTGVVYPEEHLGLVQFGMGVCVAVSWIGLLVLRRQGGRRVRGDGAEQPR
ncbi:DUF2784 domain-containing protein [Streptomonospora nanhaiensis]|uniref:DUF2784 domain-containing protein n=1 Tax=Streptomonospora nanhaiensis TaxID=1323731 RepID=A0A853BH20_9ACTN|nr:DUF2784 domain-containing protein [Streptomonospora nanhaiensis]MBV2366811.1 DUF2784 domain-containing protein [Streptomonospora nanhaiensis]MBX9390939.1 DUF2784 domain-containing protein [Streptomonospora nanhaiensis]NYI94778.1 hypothetical protein [Streptomonospora nanhaiensis]